MPQQVSSPWVAVVPAVDYRLRAHPATKWGEWQLHRPSGELGGDWSLHGPGFESGFGLGPVPLSVAHWRGFLMVVKFLAEHDADPVATIPLEEVTGRDGSGPKASSGD